MKNNRDKNREEYKIGVVLCFTTMVSTRVKDVDTEKKYRQPMTVVEVPNGKKRQSMGLNLSRS